MLLKGDPNEAPPVVGVTDSNINRPYLRRVARAALDRPGAEQRHPELQRPPGEVPAAVREQLLVPERLHLGQVDGLQLGQRRWRDGDQRPRHRRLQLRAVRLRHQAHVLVELDLRVAVGAQELVRRLDGDRRAANQGRPAAHDHPDPGPAVQRPPATGRTGSAAARPTTRRSITGSTRPASRRRPTSPAPTATPAATSSAGRVRSTSTCRSSRTRGSETSRPKCASRRSTSSTTRSSANPNTTFGNAAFGTITSMLSSPSCSLCGTVERQIQLGVKVRF